MTVDIGAFSLPLSPKIRPQVKIPEDFLLQSDPALIYIGSFLHSYLNSHLEHLWGKFDLSRLTESVVHSLAFTWNPKEYRMDEKSLPALFLWRDRTGTPTKRLSGGAISSTYINIAWIGPTEKKEQGRIKNILFPKIGQTIEAALSLPVWRDPSWVLHGEQDPHALIAGSDLAKKTCFWTRPQFLSMENFDSTMEDGTSFPGIVCRLLCAEHIAFNQQTPFHTFITGQTAVQGDLFIMREHALDTDLLISQMEAIK